MKQNENQLHRFIDEAGDTSFFMKGKAPALGQEGVSYAFIMGMVKISDPLHEVRKKITGLQQSISENPFYDVPSVRKKKGKGGYYLHATDDLPEIRKEFFDLIKTVDCSLEAVVGRKSIERFVTRHKGRQEYFYADLLSHLLKNKFQTHDKLILHVLERGQSTRHSNLNLALEKARQRFSEKNSDRIIKTEIVFDVQPPTREPLLNLTDYLCWAVQRVFEKGEIRYYNLVKVKISLVVDLYDEEKIGEGWKNFYDNKKNPLTPQNKISPHLH